MSGDRITALRQAGELLLNGWGYNWYSRENLVRADDLLVRNRAEALLGDAASALRRVEATFRRQHLPAPSRQNPLPDQGNLAQVQQLQPLLQTLERFRTELRGAAIPPDDKITRRLRREGDLLPRLVACDEQLAGAADMLNRAAAAIAPGALTDAAAVLQPLLDQFRALLDSRRALLDLPALR